MRNVKHPLILIWLLPLLMAPVVGCGAGDSATEQPGEVTLAHVERVALTETADGWEVAVTVLHEDSGWDHYADWWRILDPDGEELARRVLRHPHLDEQPFTRSLRNVALPPGLKQVVVEAHCMIHGTGGRTVTVDLTADEGPGYTIERLPGEGRP